MPHEAARAWLSKVRNPDGSWGYLPVQPGRAEPTLLVAAATGLVDLAWLEAAATGWERWLLPAALQGVTAAARLRAQAITTILGHQGVSVQETPGHDGMIPAWAWVEDTAPWVEPTCYAVLSLQAEGQGEHPRTQQGLAMIADRQCPDGGWNYGNSEVLGQPLESFPGPTAWAVMALLPGDAVDQGLARLQETLARGSTTSLALAVLAHATHQRPFDTLADALLARQADDGSFGAGRVDRTALALAALACIADAPNPFAPGPAT